MHVALAVVRRQGVEPLLHLEHIQGGHTEDLCLTALEESRPVHARKHIDLSREHADVAGTATVDANLVAQHALAHALLGHAAQCGANLLLASLESIGEGGDHVSLDEVECLLALGLAHDGEGFSHARGRDLGHGVVDVLLVVEEDGEVAHRLGRCIGERLLCLAQRADEDLARLEALSDDGLGRRLGPTGDEVDGLGRGLGLDHHDRDVIAHDPAGDDHVEHRTLKVGVTWEGHPLSVDERDAHPTDRAGEGQPGDLRRRRGGIDRKHVVEIVGVEREDRDNDLDLVAQAIGERRAQGPVDESAREDGVFSGTPLTAEERAGDPADRVHPLLDVDGEREEVEMLLGLLRRGRGAEHHRVVVEEGSDAAGGLAGQAARLEADGAGAEGAVVEDGFGGGDRTLHGSLLGCDGRVRPRRPP